MITTSNRYAVLRFRCGWRKGQRKCKSFLSSTRPSRLQLERDSNFALAWVPAPVWPGTNVLCTKKSALSQENAGNGIWEIWSVKSCISRFVFVPLFHFRVGMFSVRYSEYMFDALSCISRMRSLFFSKKKMGLQPCLRTCLRGNGIVAGLDFPFIFALPTMSLEPLKDLPHLFPIAVCLISGFDLQIWDGHRKVA